MPYKITNETGNAHSVGPYTFPEGVCFAPDLPKAVQENLATAHGLTLEPVEAIPPAPAIPPPRTAEQDHVDMSQSDFKVIDDMGVKDALPAIEALEDRELVDALSRLARLKTVRDAAAARLIQLEEHPVDSEEPDTEPAE